MRPFEIRAAISCILLGWAIVMFCIYREHMPDSLLPIFWALLGGSIAFMVAAFVKLIGTPGRTRSRYPSKP